MAMLKMEGVGECCICGKEIDPLGRCAILRNEASVLEQWHRECYELAKHEVMRRIRSTYYFEIEYR